MIVLPRAKPIPNIVIPAKAGIHSPSTRNPIGRMDSRLRGNEGFFGWAAGIVQLGAEGSPSHIPWVGVSTPNLRQRPARLHTKPAIFIRSRRRNMLQAHRRREGDHRAVVGA